MGAPVRVTFAPKPTRKVEELLEVPSPKTANDHPTSRMGFSEREALVHIARGGRVVARGRRRDAVGVPSRRVLPAGVPRSSSDDARRDGGGRRAWRVQE